MAVAIAPRARYMIVCDEILREGQRKGKLTAAGITTLVNWPGEPTTILRLDKLSVLLVLTDGRGEGTAQIVCRNEETGAGLFRTPEKSLSFVDKTPAGHYGVTFKILDIKFPAPGVYVLEFLFNGTIVAQQSLTVR